MKHMMSMAKGLSSAHFPISAVAISPRVYEALQRFNQKGGNFGDGFTNSGHPAGIAIVDQAARAKGLMVRLQGETISFCRLSASPTSRWSKPAKPSRRRSGKPNARSRRQGRLILISQRTQDKGCRFTTTKGRIEMTETDWSAGAAYVDGAFMPLKEAKLPITEWGYRRSDVTYDVVGVYFGAFFRLDDHIRRFRNSMNKLHLKPEESDERIAEILTELVRRTGLREAYVAMDCVRSRPPRGVPLHPAYGRSYLMCHAMPWVWVFTPEQQERGVHAIVASVERIAPESVDPTVKNFHWGDLTRGNFEAHAAGAETAVLLDRHGNVTEGPGYNVFAVLNGTVVTPRSGVLEGITRKSVLELCAELGIPAEVRDVPRAEFEAADEIFFSTSAGGIMPVSRLGSRILGNDRPGPIGTKIRDTFWEKRRQGWLATPIAY
jgi:branched-chain amino acid aminotransferase